MFYHKIVHQSFYKIANMHYYAQNSLLTTLLPTDFTTDRKRNRLIWALNPQILEFVNAVFIGLCRMIVRIILHVYNLATGDFYYRREKK